MVVKWVQNIFRKSQPLRLQRHGCSELLHHGMSCASLLAVENQARIKIRSFLPLFNPKLGMVLRFPNKSSAWHFPKSHYHPWWWFFYFEIDRVIVGLPIFMDGGRKPVCILSGKQALIFYPWWAWAFLSNTSCDKNFKKRNFKFSCHIYSLWTVVFFEGLIFGIHIEYEPASIAEAIKSYLGPLPDAVIKGDYHVFIPQMVHWKRPMQIG